jgi:1-pyrroline-5-carboxylate dehydrogenase
MDALLRVPRPQNEPALDYAPGSPEKKSLKAKLRQMLSETIEIPLIIGGQEVRTGNTIDAICPHDHGHALAKCHVAGPKEVEQAIAAAREAWRSWSETPWEERAAVFLKAAELLSGPWRDALNGATMLNQSKSVYQAEIDAVCETIDFYRFNSAIMSHIYSQQPASGRRNWSYIDYRPLEGFVLAVSPFNFTSSGSNLSTTPAMMGNVVLWKPASTAVYSSYCIMKLLEAAGLPPGVINFLPGSGRDVGDAALGSPEFAGLYFTGSNPTFNSIWRTISRNLTLYKGYPRIIGETGGKDFIFAHASADVEELAVALARGAFEYQGQKCSAVSRAYIPRSLWSKLRERLQELIAEIRVGDPMDFRNFMNAVIDRNAFKSILGYIGFARESQETKILCGGTNDASRGYFVQPTLIETENPRIKLMSEEIFGPVLTVYPYEDARFEEALDLCDTTSPYGLTGAVFAHDRSAIAMMSRRLRHTAGNFYINDKPTGAVVGQQPFGGGRGSGTNDKAGSALSLIKWTSPRAIKENFVPPRQFPYPFMGEE